MTFSAQEAFDARDEGEPILLSRADALRLVHEHGIGSDAFDAEVAAIPCRDGARYDAADVLEWLGY